MTTKQNFSILHEPLKPHNYPSDWNKQHDALFGQYMCGIEKTCGINQSGGQYRTREYLKSRLQDIWPLMICFILGYLGPINLLHLVFPKP